MDNNRKFNPLHEVFGGFVNTRSGANVSILEPYPDTIIIEDIAGALAKTCRYNGQTNMFISVAQHSVLVAAMAPAPLKRAAFLLNATVAYIGDVIPQVKQVFGPAFDMLEENLLKVIADKFGVAYSDFERVREYDKAATLLEHEVFQKGNMNQWYSICLEAEINTTVYQWEKAEQYYLANFYQIFGAGSIEIKKR